MSESALYTGMQLEVFSASAGNLLFEARVTRVVREDFAEIERTSDAFPVLRGGEAVRLRGYNAKENRGVWLEGMLSPFGNHGEFWLVEGMKVTGQDGGRSSSRSYGTNAAGYVRPADAPETQDAPCRVSNVSTGGAAIRTAEEFSAGDVLLLSVKLRRGHAQPPLRCAVRRVTRRDEGYEYGCQFLEDSPEAGDAIIKTVLEIQMMGMPHAVELPPQQFRI